MDTVENEYSQKASEMITLAISELKDTINKKIAEGKAFDNKIEEARQKVAFLKAELEGLKNSMN